MEIKVKYVDVQKRYPKSVSEAMKELGKSKSKFKNEKPENLNWSFQWCQRIDGGCSFADMIANFAKEKVKEEPKNVDEKFEEIRKNVFASVAVGGKGSSMLYHSETLDVIPVEIEKHYKDAWADEFVEKARYDALPKAEQDKELEDTIKQLSSMGGFMGMQIGPKGVKRII